MITADRFNQLFFICSIVCLLACLMFTLRVCLMVIDVKCSSLLMGAGLWGCHGTARVCFGVQDSFYLLVW